MNYKTKHQHSFSFNIDESGTTSSLLGSSALSSQNIAQAQQKLAKAYAKLTQQQDKIKLFSICDSADELVLAQKYAAEIKENYDKLIIFGMGGSSLGGQALCGTKFYQLVKNQEIDLVFIDNIHYHNFNIFLQELDFKKTAFLTISKSGGTLETLAQITVTLDFFKNEISQYSAQNFYFISELSTNPISKLAEKYQATLLPHDPDIGGRYSCFTAVSMLPAALSGFDLSSYQQGGQKIVSDFLDNAHDSLVFSGATTLLAAMLQGYPNQVFIPYLQRLYQMIYWYAQLFAESLGKDGKGMTPIKALGSVDQHSQLQLFLDGPKDKFFTFITQSTSNLGNKIKLDTAEFPELDYLNNNCLGDVINANQEATIATLIEQGCPVRRFHFHEFSDQAVGEILMYFMLETILLGYALEINPFDQPAVEIGKQKARKLLADTTI